MKITQKLKIMLRALILKAGELETDKGRLIYDGDELTVGTDVFIEQAGENDEIEVVPAPDGEYEADGRTYVVAEGRIAEIREPEEPAEQEEMEDEPAAEPADDNDQPEEGQSLEERVAALEGRVGEILEGIEGILNGIAALEQRIEALEAKVAGLEEPAADPIDENDGEFSEQPKSRLQILRELNK